MKKNTSIFFLFLIISSNLFSQVTEEWAKRYNGPGNFEDQACSIAVDNLGNIIVTGYSWGVGGVVSYATVKYNSNGIQQWVRRYCGPDSNFSRAKSVAVDNAGNIYVTGYSSNIGTDFDIATIKYNSSGEQIWVRRFNNNENKADYGMAISVDNHNNICVTGYSIFAGHYEDFITLKYNSSGVQLWEKRYDGTANGTDEARTIAIDKFDNIYICGESWNTGNYNAIATVKYDSSGNQMWVQRFSFGTDVASIKIDSECQVYIAASQRTGSFGFPQALTIKYNSDGIIQWSKIYGGSTQYADGWKDIAIDKLGNVILTGYTSMAYSNSELVILKYNALGIEKWVQSFNLNNSNSNCGYSVKVDSICNIYITGSCNNGTNYDGATLKYDSSGVQKWLKVYNGQSNGLDVLQALTLDKLGNILVTGYSYGFDYDYVTIKYSQPIGIEPISTEVPKQFSLSQNYPNPFNPVTKIKFEAPLAPPEGGMQIVSLEIYDALGRKVSSIFSSPWGRIGGAAYEVEWDGSNYPSGIYFYQLSINNEKLASRKMVLLK